MTSEKHSMNNFYNIQLDFDPRGFATLWLDRPEKHNAFDAAMLDELLAALDIVEEHAEARFLVLRGRGANFCAGADLAWMHAGAELDYNGNLRDAQVLAELIYNLHRLKLPTLAVVQGCAMGGGLGLVACCDIAIGADDARFALSEVRLGLAPAVIAPFVVQAIGERAARRYALSAEHFDGARACTLGLLAESHPAAELEAALEQWIARLLGNGPQAMRATKALLHEVGSGTLSPTLRRHTESAIARLRSGEEGQEGLRAFLDKRHPAWHATD